MNVLKLEQAANEIGSLNSSDGSFPRLLRRMMGSLRSFIPCETVNLGVLDLATEEGLHVDLDGFLMPAERREILPRFIRQHPMLEHARQNSKTNPPLRFTDFHSRRQLEELPLYRECYRGYTHSMLSFGVPAPAGLNISFVLSRESGDFFDEEVRQLQILQPLMVRTYQYLLLETTVKSCQVNSGSVGLVMGRGRNAHALDEQAVELIREFFEIEPPFSLPLSLLETVNRRPREVLCLKDRGEGGALHGYWEPDGLEWLLRIWREGDTLNAEHLRRVGLSARQIEILQWVVRGKSNPEIGLILGISFRTVQKHLENAYRILGVESRHAAIKAVQGHTY